MPRELFAVYVASKLEYHSLNSYSDVKFIELKALSQAVNHGSLLNADKAAPGLIAGVKLA
jgi:hypothetical protein